MGILHPSDKSIRTINIFKTMSEMEENLRMIKKINFIKTKTFHNAEEIKSDLLVLIKNKNSRLSQEDHLFFTCMNLINVRGCETSKPTCDDLMKEGLLCEECLGYYLGYHKNQNVFCDDCKEFLEKYKQTDKANEICLCCNMKRFIIVYNKMCYYKSTRSSLKFATALLEYKLKEFQSYENFRETMGRVREKNKCTAKQGSKANE